MPTLNRDGVNIYYEIHGRGPALLLSHGYSATSEMWRNQILPLSRAHTVIVWDMRGHGQTDSPDQQSEYSEEKTVGDMSALLDLVRAERGIIAGLSLGGYMSLAFHLAHAERVRALMIIDTGPGFRSQDARERWNNNATDIARKLEAQGLDCLLSLSKERSLSRHRSAAGLIRAACGMLTQRDSRVIDSLPQIHVPTLIIVGADDTPFHNAANYMSEKIPDSTRITIPGAGHAVNIDQPELFNTAVLEFLEKLGKIVDH